MPGHFILEIARVALNRKRTVDGRKNNYCQCTFFIIFHLFIHSISQAPFQPRHYSETLPTQHVYCVGVSRRSATGNCELRACPRSVQLYVVDRVGFELATLLVALVLVELEMKDMRLRWG